MGMREPIKEIADRFSLETGVKVLLSFSSSGKLARQIEAGVPCDVFISASVFWTEYLVERHIINSFRPFATTKLVIVSPQNIRFSDPKDICKAERVAIGNYKFAPFGKYALSALKNTGLYQCVKDRLLLANHVAQAAMWVVTGNVDAGIIYFSDYLRFKDKLKLVWVFPEGSHEKILFTAAYLTPEGKKFFDFLFSRRMSPVLKRWGFEPVSDFK